MARGVHKPAPLPQPPVSSINRRSSRKVSLNKNPQVRKSLSLDNVNVNVNSSPGRPDSHTAGAGEGRDEAGGDFSHNNRVSNISVHSSSLTEQGSRPSTTPVPNLPDSDISQEFLESGRRDPSATSSFDTPKQSTVSEADDQHRLSALTFDALSPPACHVDTTAADDKQLAVGVRAASCYNSLPRSSLAAGRTNQKSVSRSLVPRIRQIFEKSRSCEPDVVTSSTPPTDWHHMGDSGIGGASGMGGPWHSSVRLRRHQTDRSAKDGTESTSSSFILLLEPSTCTDGSSTANGGHQQDLDAAEEERRLGQSLTVNCAGETDLSGADRRTSSPDRKAKGFVNKCVTKVKSMIGKLEE